MIMTSFPSDVNFIVAFALISAYRLTHSMKVMFTKLMGLPTVTNPVVLSTRMWNAVSKNKINYISNKGTPRSERGVT